MSEIRHGIMSCALLGVLCVAAGADAADEIGIFFDPDALSNQGSTSEPAEILTAYLVILEPSATEAVTGWECEISWFTEGPDLIPLQWNLRGNATNFDDPPRFQVGVGTPLPLADQVVLMDFLVLVPTVADWSVLFVEAHPVPSVVYPPHSDYRLHQPIYASGSQGDLIPLVQASGCESLPVAEINGPAPTPAISLEGPTVAILPHPSVDYTQLPLINDGDSPISALVQVSASTDVYLRIEAGGWVAGPGPLSLQVQPGATTSVGIKVIDDDQLPLTFSVTSCDQILLETSVSRGEIRFLPDPEGVTFDAVPLGDWAYQTVIVENITMHPLYLDLMTICAPWGIGPCGSWSVDPIELELPGWGTAAFEVSFHAESEGFFACDVQVDAHDGSYAVVVPCRAYAGNPLQAPGVRARPQLLAAYPNPFNPRTTVAFTLPATERARLRVYDVAGRMVATLLDEVRGAGRHEVIWEGVTDGGLAAPSGVYFCRLETGDWRDTRRMVLAR